MANAALVGVFGQPDINNVNKIIYAHIMIIIELIDKLYCNYKCFTTTQSKLDTCPDVVYLSCMSFVD